MHDSELIKRYTLDRAGIMFLTDLIWDANISDNMQKCHSAEMEVITSLTKLSYLATGKMQLCSIDDLGLLQHLQWGKKVFSQPPIVQVLPLKKMREACNFHHRYTSTMRDKIRKENPENHIVGFWKNLFASYGGK